MRVPRIYAERILETGSAITLPEQSGKHLTRVLRLRAGDAVIVFNGDGLEYDATITCISRQGVDVQISARRRVDRESPLQVTLAQAVARGERMDWVIQKATELGVHNIVPLVTERTEVKLAGDRAARRRSHWQGVMIAACEQSGRARLPGLEPVQPLPQWLAGLASVRATRLTLSPQAQIRLREVPPEAAAVILAIGPEGGFSDRDLGLLSQAGFQAVRAGPRTLRTESAGVAALAALQALFGDL